MGSEITRRAEFKRASVIDPETAKAMRIKELMFPYLSPEQADRLSDVLDEVIAPKRPEKDNGRLILEFVAAKQVEGLSRRTLEAYAGTARAFAEHVGKNLADVSAADVRDYLGFKMATTCSPVGADNIRRNLSSMYAWMESEELVEKSPMRSVKEIKRKRTLKRPFDAVEVERLRDACSTLRERFTVEFLLSSGVRVAELVTLRKKDVDSVARHAHVLGKGNKVREVYFSPAALVWMEKYHEDRALRFGEDDTDYLLASSLRRGGKLQPLSTGSVESMVKLLGEKARVENCHPHRFRRTMATSALRKGMRLDQVRELLGHESVSTTTLYAMTDHDETMDAARRLIG